LLRSRKVVFVLFAIGVVAGASLAACSDDEPAPGGGVRTIEVRARDEFAFEPPEVDVRAGETVRFVVTNEGEQPHEFVLGDEAVQQEHEGQMDGSMDHGAMDMGDMPALELAPGETEEATVTFREPGEVRFGCHVPGHYDAGMVGTVVVG